MECLAGGCERTAHFIEGCVGLPLRLADHPFFKIVLKFVKGGFRGVDVILLVLTV
jgi:hypothetical protein